MSTPATRVLDWLRHGDIDVRCCTHTGLPYAQDYPHPDGRGLVVNNGCAGLSAVAGRHHVCADPRLSAYAEPPADSL